MNDHARHTLRPGLPALPARVRKLPLDRRGYPIPWFVYTAEDGTRDFRVADNGKRLRAVKEKLCWICGQRMPGPFVFLIGPMCAVNRNTSEPPSHRDCADFAVRACPFMVLPEAQYRRANLPSDTRGHPYALDGNPGATCMWVTDSFKPYRVPGMPQDWLIDIGPPIDVLWFARGRTATRAEVIASLDARIHKLVEVAQAHDEMDALLRAVWGVEPFLPTDGKQLPALIARAA
jgi:hypothetical protein